MDAKRGMLALLGATLFWSTASAQETAVPALPNDGPARPAGADDGFYRASELIGTTVRGDDGQELGKVQDLLIERRDQRIRYFLLGDGEQLNEQSNLRVIPWTVATPKFVGNDHFVTVRVDQQRWRQAPAYTWREIQSGPGPWATEVDRFYGVTLPGNRGRDGARDRDRGRDRVEIERDGDVEIKNRDRRDGEARSREKVEIERDGDVKIKERGRDRDRDGVQVNPDGSIQSGNVRVGPNGVQIKPDQNR